MTDVDSAIERADRAQMEGVRPAAWSWAQDAVILAAEVKRLREALDRCRKGINTWDDK